MGNLSFAVRLLTRAPVICGVLIYHVENDFSGFQNRIGIFLFTLALFGFSCLTTLSLFAHERLLFMRERSNGYYSTLTYFSSKVRNWVILLVLY